MMPNAPNKPLDEVVLGITFAAPEFSLVDYGLLYTEFQREFPEVSTHPPLVNSNSPGSFQLMLPQLPRVWFASEDGHYIVQIQHNRLLLNWKTHNGSGDYPGFESLFPMFQSILDRFSSHLASRGRFGSISVQQYEFTYLNAIKPEFVGMLEGPLFRWEASAWKDFLPDPINRNVDFLFEFPAESIRLRATANSAFYVPLQMQVLNFSLSATSIQSTEMGSWFSSARATIRKAFEELLTDDALDRWGVRRNEL